MSESLPLEARQYIDETSTIASIRNLTDAAERGEIGIDVLARFVRLAGDGRIPQFAKTKPVPIRIAETIRATPGTEPRQVLYKGVAEGWWSWEDAEAFEANAATLSEARSVAKPAAKGVYLTRGRRSRKVPPRTESMFVPKMSLDAFCHHGLRDGAKTCLALILSLAGKLDHIVTFTSSLATMLGRTARTVRNYFAELEEAGLIERSEGRTPNTVRIAISSACRPEPYKESVADKALKLARRSADPVLRAMADTVARVSFDTHRAQFDEKGGRKEISPFNPRFSSSSRNHRSCDHEPVQRGSTTHSTIKVTHRFRHPSSKDAPGREYLDVKTMFELYRRQTGSADRPPSEIRRFLSEAV